MGRFLEPVAKPSEVVQTRPSSGRLICVKCTEISSTLDNCQTDLTVNQVCQISLAAQSDELAHCRLLALEAGPRAHVGRPLVFSKGDASAATVLQRPAAPPQSWSGRRCPAPAERCRAVAADCVHC